MANLMNQALVDTDIVNILYQQPQLIPIIEHLVKQESQQLPLSLTQRSFNEAKFIDGKF